ncbi:hypothetical protein ACTG16_22170 [Aeromonas sp. 23P]|uniref:hypothetical protein n=1 Tax=Aeromonas sp. 23P TaxID=3452716 RepID=UPI003F7A2338
MGIFNLIARDGQIAKQLLSVYDNYRGLTKKILMANTATNRQIEININKDKNACLFGISGISFHYNGVGRDYYIPVCNLCDQIKTFTPHEFTRRLRSENPFIESILIMLLFWKSFSRSVAISTIAIPLCFWLMTPESGGFHEIGAIAIGMILYFMPICAIYAAGMSAIKKGKIFEVVGFYLQILGETDISSLSDVEISIQQNRFAAFLP